MPASLWRIKNELLSSAILLIFAAYMIRAFSAFEMQEQAFLIKLYGTFFDIWFLLTLLLLDAFKKQIVQILYT